MSKEYISPRRLSTFFNGLKNLFATKNEVSEADNVLSNRIKDLEQNASSTTLVGKSAYEIALDHGFEGSEEEWLESLVGMTGKSAYAYAKDGGYEGTDAEFARDINPYNINANSMNFIAEELAKREQLTPEFAQTIEECTDTTKLYVLPDGYIYAYITTTQVVEKYQNAADPTSEDWLTGTRLGNAGLSTSEARNHITTNPIPCKTGDTLYVQGAVVRGSNCYIAFMSDFGVYRRTLTNHLMDGTDTTGYFEYSKDGDTDVFKILSDAAGTYVRFCLLASSNPENLIVSVNNPILPPEEVETQAWTNTSVKFISDINTNDPVVQEIVREESRNQLSSIQLTPEFANDVSDCADTTKMYVLPDGFIYAYMMTEVSVGGCTNLAEPQPDNTTDTSKWVNGYRFSSGGIEAQSGTTLSNLIPCKVGDVIRIKGVTLRGSTDRIAIYFTNESGKATYAAAYFNAGITNYNCGVAYKGLSNEVYTFEVTSGNGTVTGFRFAMPTPEDAGKVIVTVNEEIKETTAEEVYAWTSTGHAFVPADYEDRIITVEDSTKTNKTSIATLTESVVALESKLENTNYLGIPSYWDDSETTYLTNRINRIKELHNQYGKDCFSFVLFADTHYPSNLGKVSPLLAKRIMDETDIKYALHVGDWQTRGCHKTKEALLAENDNIKAMFAPIQDKLLMEQGNHDGAYGWLDRNSNGAYSNSGTTVSNRETYVYNLTPAELFNFAYRKVGLNNNAHFDETGTAYYIDDTSNNVRYIGLNTHCSKYEKQDDGTQLYPKMWVHRFTQPQFDFLTQEALVEGMKDTTRIVIFAHIPVTQEIGDRDIMVGVLKAFKNKTTYSGTYAGEFDFDAVSVDVDFTQAKGKLVGYFHGHTHLDSLNTANGFNIIGSRCDAREENDRYNADGTENTGGMWHEKQVGTTSEQSFDVFTITPDTIYATKIGAGNDREISY